MYLITGAAGFVGFHLSLSLLKKQKKVIGVDNISDYYDTKIKFDRLKILRKFPNFIFYKIDLKNKKNISKKINKYKNKIQIIVHFAGQAGVRYSILNPITYIENNIISYVNLLEFFKDTKKIKLVIYASSSSVYGEKGSKKAVSSLAQTNPISVYSASKLSMELISKVYSHLYKINTIGVRFFTVFGPWGRPDMFYLKLLRGIKSNRNTNIYNYGKHYRSFTYIDDVILNLFKIINKFMTRGKKVSDVFNVGNPNSIHLKKFIGLVEKKMGKRAKKRYIKKQLGDLTLTKSNVLREKKIFNHEIRVDLNTGVDKLIKWYNSYYK